MSERTSYEPGTPSWVDLSTPDPAAAKRFYGELFGWEAEEAGPPEETGGYALFKLRGQLGAGGSPLVGENPPPGWGAHVSPGDPPAGGARAPGGGGGGGG